MLRLRAGAIALAVVLGVVLLPAAPAFAHDELLSSSPAADERLDVAPGEVTLTFSDEILDTGAAVIIADASGRDWVDGEPRRDGATVVATVAVDMPTGGYEVRWRVVSSDGHPISGIIPFTVGDAAALERTATASGAPEPAAEDQTTQENEGALRVVLIGVAGAAVAAAGYAVILLVRRRRRAPGDDNAS